MDRWSPLEERCVLRELSSELNDLSRQVIGAAIEVHRHLGAGHLEQVYENALCVELRLRGICFERQRSFKMIYKGESVGEGRMDLVVDKRLILELKAVEQVVNLFRAQLRSYLRATGIELGLLINFNTPRLVDGVERLVNTRQFQLS